MEGALGLGKVRRFKGKKKWEGGARALCDQGVPCQPLQIVYMQLIILAALTSRPLVA